MSSVVDPLIKSSPFLLCVVQDPNQSFGVGSDLETSGNVICVMLATGWTLDVNGMTKGALEHFIRFAERRTSNLSLTDPKCPSVYQF